MTNHNLLDSIRHFSERHNGQRFGQFLSNALANPGGSVVDRLFFIEDAQLADLLAEALGETPSPAERLNDAVDRMTHERGELLDQKIRDVLTPPDSEQPCRPLRYFYKFKDDPEYQKLLTDNRKKLAKEIADRPKDETISDCCHASADVAHGDEETNHYVCSKCGNACDLMSPQTPDPRYDPFIRRALDIGFTDDQADFLWFQTH